MRSARKAKLTDAAPRPVARKKRRSPGELTDRLIQAAGEEFRRHGYTGATTAAIARRADVTEAQLFRYFGSKAELFREAIFKPLNRHFVDFNARHLAAVGDMTSIRDKAHLYISELQQFIGAHSKVLMSLVVAQTYSPGRTESVAEIDSLDAYFKRGAAMMARRLDKKPRVDPKLMVRVSFAAVLACVMFKDWIFPRGLAGEDEISAAIQDFVMDGINANSHLGEHAGETP
jgi:AcrR family transcriptional regulator